MDNSKWAFAPDTPDWPIDAQGEKEKAVLLTSTFDSTADADMRRQPVRSRLPAGGRQGNSGGPAGGGTGAAPGVIEGKEIF